MQINEDIVGFKFKSNSFEDKGKKNVLAYVNGYVWG